MIKLACATLSIEGFSETNYNKVFETAPEIGYEHIEFNCWYPSSLAPATIASLKERCDAANLSPMAIHLNGGLGGELYKDFCHKLWTMKAVKALGGKRIVTSGPNRGKDGGIDSVIASLKALAPVAEELDVLICLENHFDNEIEFIEDYSRILDAVPSPNVGICIDTGHFDASGVDMNLLIDKFASRINHIHLKENAVFGKKTFCRFNEGTTDNHGIVKRMIDLGYSGYLTVELSPEIGETDGRPFTQADLALPYNEFKVYETK